MHTIVYRPSAKAHDAVAEAILGSSLVTPEQPLWQRQVVPDAVLLFRYSALTFNSHRIHYDRPYVTQVEACPGLVVHGPLIAALLVNLVRRHSQRPLKNFAFKALRPSFECADARALTLRAQITGDSSMHLWAQDHEGFVVMQASAQFQSGLEDLQVQDTFTTADVHPPAIWICDGPQRPRKIQALTQPARFFWPNACWFF